MNDSRMDNKTIKMPINYGSFLTRHRNNSHAKEKGSKLPPLIKEEKNINVQDSVHVLTAGTPQEEEEEGWPRPGVLSCE